VGGFQASGLVCQKFLNLFHPFSKPRLLVAAALYSSAHAVAIGQLNADIVALIEPEKLLDNGDAVAEGTADIAATEDDVTEPIAARLKRLERRLQYGWANDAVLAVSVRKKGMKCI
jgi:hypothetical protein